MLPQEENQIMTWIKCLAVCMILILPARCYTGIYLHFFDAPSNISVYYLNLVDLAIVLVTVFFTLGQHKIIIESRAVPVYVVINIVMLLIAVVAGYMDYIGELLSKSLIVLCAGVLASQIRRFTDAQKSSIYLVSLTILVVASFFLSGYKGYATMNRVGSLGFGTNETANFACCILAVALFVSNINIWLRAGASVLAVACILNVASRRGMIVAIGVFIIWALASLWKKKNSKIASRTFFATLAIIVAGIVFIILRHEQIMNYINSSALMVRYRFTVKYNNEFMDYSGRVSIYKEVADYIKDHILFGSYGCDKIFAQGHIAHAHNLLLQFIATYGLLIGPIYAGYAVVTFLRAIKMMHWYIERKESAFPAIVSLFFILYFTFEMFGYLLWNPKGLFWIVLTMILIRFEYRDCFARRAASEG